MISDAKKFLKDNLEYIQRNDIEGFFMLAEEELGYKNITYLRDLFRYANIDPLPYLKKLPDGYYLLDNLMHEFISPKHIDTIGYRALSGSDIQTTTITSNVKEVQIAAFQDCDFLQRATFEEGVIVIDDYAFAGCSELFNVTLPKSLASLGRQVFKDCEELKELNYRGTKEEWHKIKIPHDFMFNYVHKIKCTDGVVDLLQI